MTQGCNWTTVSRQQLAALDHAHCPNDHYLIGKNILCIPHNRTHEEAHAAPALSAWAAWKERNAWWWDQVGNLLLALLGATALAVGFLMALGLVYLGITALVTIARWLPWPA